MERERQARWDAAHLCTASTRLQLPQYMDLRALCECQGTTVYALIKELLEAWMDAIAGNREQEIEGQQEIE